MEMSVTSGDLPAATLGTSVATNTFRSSKAKTGSLGSPEANFLSGQEAEHTK